MFHNKPKYRWPEDKAALIYESYPDNDLLPFDPPKRGTPIGELVSRVLGDTLFLFLCSEANDRTTPRGYLRKLDRAIEDIRAVRREVAKIVQRRSRATPGGE